MSEFFVAEKFVSINGEGAKAGELAVFVRFYKCNLNCGYCDTKWANDKTFSPTSESLEDIVSFVESTGVKNVTLTGGEPLLQKDISRLIERLIQNGNAVEIETNGSIPIGEFATLEKRPAFTMDYKLPSSGMEKHMRPENFAHLDFCDSVKFVVGDMRDLVRAQEVIAGYALLTRCKVYLSPVFGQIRPDEIVEFMKEKKLNGVKLQLQLHKFIWKPDERGV